MIFTRDAWRCGGLAVTAAMFLAGVLFSSTVFSGTAAAGDEPAGGAVKPRAEKAGDKAVKRAADAASLDDQLLQDLDNELLPAGADDARPGATGSDGEEDPEAAMDTVDRDDQDPLSRIGDKMRKAERLIERNKSAPKGEELQRQIVADLDLLIDEMRKKAQKECSGSSSSQKTAQREQPKQSKPSGSKPGKNDGPAKDSTERLGKNETHQPDMAQMRDLMKDIWGQLPVHDREQMLQFAPEQFLPKYELLIEKYYKRLAEEQNGKP